MYYSIGSLLPAHQPAAVLHFAQLYIYDTQHEIQNRLHIIPSLDATILASLQQMLDEVNPYVTTFRQVRHILEQTPPPSTLSMVIKADRVKDPRRYNIPTADEVAAIMVGDGQQPEPSHRDIIISLHDSHQKRVSELHRSYIPLHYVLLFPRGDDGWHPWIPVHGAPLIAEEDAHDSEEDDQPQDDDCRHTAKRKHITIMQFYAYRLQVRIGEGRGLHLAGRLFQQYIVDAYAVMEQNRLNYIKANQKKIRAELYQGKHWQLLSTVIYILVYLFF